MASTFAHIIHSLAKICSNTISRCPCKRSSCSEAEYESKVSFNLLAWTVGLSHFELTLYLRTFIGLSPFGFRIVGRL